MNWWRPVLAPHPEPELPSLIVRSTRTMGEAADLIARQRRLIQTLTSQRDEALAALGDATDLLRQAHDMLDGRPRDNQPTGFRT